MFMRIPVVRRRMVGMRQSTMPTTIELLLWVAYQNKPKTKTKKEEEEECSVTTVIYIFGYSRFI